MYAQYEQIKKPIAKKKEPEYAPIKLKVEHEFSWFDIMGVFIFAWLMFWQQSGWYRVDCALGTKAACILIDNEYAKKYGAQEKPVRKENI